MFTLHPRLEADTVELGRLPLCVVRLSLDANYPWVVLVPARPDLTELHQLAADERHQLSDESAAVASAMQKVLGADKINIASLGNLVQQLHVHVVARYDSDPAWPGPVWGAVPSRSYTDSALAQRIAELREAFAQVPDFVAGPA